jgi:hypothetical protein
MVLALLLYCRFVSISDMKREPRSWRTIHRAINHQVIPTARVGSARVHRRSLAGPQLITHHEPYTKMAAAPLQTQAHRLFEKFGGAMRLVAALKACGCPRARWTVFKWAYPLSKGGTGGLIPSRAWPDILYAARCEGVVLDKDVFDPIVVHRSLPYPRRKAYTRRNKYIPKPTGG